MRKNNQAGSIVTLLCDSGDRYLDTYYDKQWVHERFGDLDSAQEQLQRCIR